MGNNNFKKEVISAYRWIRKNNNSIPDDVLDLMKNAALEYEALKTQNKSLSWDVDVLAVENVLLIEALKPFADLLPAVTNGYGMRPTEGAIQVWEDRHGRHELTVEMIKKAHEVLTKF